MIKGRSVLKSRRLSVPPTENKNSYDDNKDNPVEKGKMKRDSNVGTLIY